MGIDLFIQPIVSCRKTTIEYDILLTAIHMSMQTWNLLSNYFFSAALSFLHKDTMLEV